MDKTLRRNNGINFNKNLADNIFNLNSPHCKTFIQKKQKNN